MHVEALGEDNLQTIGNGSIKIEEVMKEMILKKTKNIQKSKEILITNFRIYVGANGAAKKCTFGRECARTELVTNLELAKAFVV